MERKTQTGYLALADISGYTSFIAKTEIEHAENVISPLLGTIIEKLRDMFTIVKLEGDAVFAYAPDDQVSNGRVMLELLDDTYLIFRDSAKAMYEQATCPCRACKAIPTLDLKFFVHHGESVDHESAQQG